MTISIEGNEHDITLVGNLVSVEGLVPYKEMWVTPQVRDRLESQFFQDQIWRNKKAREEEDLKLRGQHFEDSMERYKKEHPRRSTPE